MAFGEFALKTPLRNIKSVNFDRFQYNPSSEITEDEFNALKNETINLNKKIINSMEEYLISHGPLIDRQTYDILFKELLDEHHKLWCQLYNRSEYGRTVINRLAKKHSDRIKEQRKKYRTKHCGELKQKRKKYHEKHKEEIRVRKRKYRKEHKEEMLVKERKYRKEHKEEIKERRQKHYKENKEKITEQSRQYYQEHREEICRKLREKRAKKKAEKEAKKGESM